MSEEADSEDGRWVPDGQLVAAVLAGGKRRMSELSMPDRCWLVAGLTAAGLTAGDIADRLDCSLRLVRAIRAEDMTMVCVHFHSETRNFSDELRRASVEASVMRRRIAELESEVDRTRTKLDRMIDAHIVGVKPCPKCGTPMDKWNAYECGGKVYCRECHRERQRVYRERAKSRAGLPFALPRGDGNR